jgi:hypothetical protein
LVEALRVVTFVVVITLVVDFNSWVVVGCLEVPILFVLVLLDVAVLAFMAVSVPIVTFLKGPKWLLPNLDIVEFLFSVFLPASSRVLPLTEAVVLRSTFVGLGVSGIVVVAKVEMLVVGLPWIWRIRNKSLID